MTVDGECHSEEASIRLSGLSTQMLPLRQEPKPALSQVTLGHFRLPEPSLMRTRGKDWECCHGDPGPEGEQ